MHSLHLQEPAHVQEPPVRERRGCQKSHVGATAVGQQALPAASGQRPALATPLTQGRSLREAHFLSSGARKSRSLPDLTPQEDPWLQTQPKQAGAGGQELLSSQGPHLPSSPGSSETWAEHSVPSQQSPTHRGPRRDRNTLNSKLKAREERKCSTGLGEDQGTARADSGNLLQLQPLTCAPLTPGLGRVPPKAQNRGSLTGGAGAVGIHSELNGGEVRSPRQRTQYDTAAAKMRVGERPPRADFIGGAGGPGAKAPPPPLHPPRGERAARGGLGRAVCTAPGRAHESPRAAGLAAHRAVSQPLCPPSVGLPKVGSLPCSRVCSGSPVPGSWPPSPPPAPCRCPRGRRFPQPVCNPGLCLRTWG